MKNLHNFHGCQDVSIQDLCKTEVNKNCICIMFDVHTIPGLQYSSTLYTAKNDLLF